MADYVKDIPNGQMMIRDLGYDVQFFFKTGSSTWNNQQDWGWSIDGGGFNMGVFKLSTGGAWHHLGTIQVGAGNNRLVTMRIVGEGLGWNTTDHSVWIPRATVPNAPHWVDGPRATGTSQAYMQFSGNGDGGTPVREWQIGYGTDPNGPQYYVGSGGGTTIGGLNPQWWFFWARGRNDVGWGPWSGRGQAHPWRVPDAPSPVSFSAITQKSIRTKFSAAFDGGTPVREWQLAYGLTQYVDQATLVASSGVLDLNNLDPGRIYYFWARGRNDVGWGPYSPVRVQALIAGAAVKDQSTWKRAVPYVRVNGVWRLARPWVKSAGEWKEVPR